MKEEPTYFVVITFRHLLNDYRIANDGNIECVFKGEFGINEPCSLMGVFLTEERAVEAILKNETGFDEQWTDYCVLEERKEGFYPLPIRSRFFKFVFAEERFVEVNPGESKLIDKFVSENTTYNFI